ncbi:hypothetical protein [Sphingobium cloacae]|nr:hypothetical protein [Sphingobium cloacae]
MAIVVAGGFSGAVMQADSRDMPEMDVIRDRVEKRTVFCSMMAGRQN